MKTTSKSAENLEFAALMQQMKSFGFRPADVARMLNKSPGAVSQYLSGYTNPSMTVLELLRRIVHEKQMQDEQNKIAPASPTVTETKNPRLRKLAGVEIDTALTTSPPVESRRSPAAQGRQTELASPSVAIHDLSESVRKLSIIHLLEPKLFEKVKDMIETKYEKTARLRKIFSLKIFISPDTALAETAATLEKLGTYDYESALSVVYQKKPSQAGDVRPSGKILTESGKKV